MLGTSFSQNNTLIIHVTDLRNSEGQIILDIFKSEKGFPMKTEISIIRKSLSIPIGEEAVFSVTGLPNGEYAFALNHDENMNNKLDQNFIGIPRGLQVSFVQVNAGLHQNVIFLRH